MSAGAADLTAAVAVLAALALVLVLEALARRHHPRPPERLSPRARARYRDEADR